MAVGDAQIIAQAVTQLGKLMGADTINAIKSDLEAVEADVSGKADLAGGNEFSGDQSGKFLDRGGAAYNSALFASLDAMVTEIGAAQATILLAPGDTKTLTGNLTIPANVTLDARMGVIETNGFTLTVNGPVVAGNWQVFDVSGGGSVVFGSGVAEQVNVKWFGAAGDGATEDTVAFTAARDAAGVGGHVRVSPGTYMIDDMRLDVADQSWVLDAGATVKWKDSAVGDFMFRVVADNVWITGRGTIDGNRANNPLSTGGKGVRVDAKNAAGPIVGGGLDGIRIKNIPGEDAVYITGTRSDGHIVYDYSVLNCTIHDCDRNGITIIDGEHIRVAGNHIRNVRVGIDLEPNTGAENVYNCIIEGNHIRDVVVDGIDVAGFYNHITGNQITNPTIHGIVLASNTNRNKIVGNTVYGAGGRGIYDQGSLYSVIIGNHLAECVGDGIETNGRAVIQGNIVYACGTRGIYVAANGGCIITDNWFHHEAADSMTTAIDLNSTGGNTVSNVRHRLITAGNLVVNSRDTDFIWLVSDEVQQVAQFAQKNLVIENGTTANRPASPKRGQLYWDITLGKMIAYSGAAWVNVDGSAL